MLDRDALIKRIDAGWSPGFLLFWGHGSTPDAPIGKSCLSQWFPASFAAGGTTYATAEHYMMAEKALLFRDDEAAHRIVSTRHPADAKALGRSVRGFDDATWKLHRSRIVAEGSYAKFSQNPKLCDFLLATGERILVEASPRDAIWGIGLGEKNPRAREPSQWRGLNLLGFALMHARARLFEERSKTGSTK